MAQQDILPIEFMHRLEKLVGYQKKEEILQAFATLPRLSFRVNTLVSSRDVVRETLEQHGFLLDPVAWYEDAFVVSNKTKRELTDTDLYTSGAIYIQNLSSMIPVLALAPQPNDLVLDLAAAPGSKTTQIACMMQDSGELVANDSSRERIYKLRENLGQQHVTNATIVHMRGELLWHRYPEYFDKVLVDAPCSMEGRIRLDEPKSYADWSLKRIKDLSTRQKYLLRGAVTATKPGGTIIYSTCTLAPEENEAVIDWLLNKEGDTVSIEQISLPHLSLAPGNVSWEKVTNPVLADTARIWPSEAMEGFFIAKIKKHASTLPFPKELRSRFQKRK